LIFNILNHFQYQLIPVMSFNVLYNALIHRLKDSSSVGGKNTSLINFKCYNDGCAGQLSTNSRIFFFLRSNSSSQ
jgi:hypothetical protein